jgi:hypothetical protein
MGLRIGAVVVIGLVVAGGLALLAREHAVYGQIQRDVEKDTWQRQAELLDKMRRLEAQKADLEERAQKLQAEVEAFNELAASPRRPESPGGQQAQRVDDKPKPADFKRDVPRPTFQGARPQGWEYQVLSLTDSDEAMNQNMRKLTDDGWEYLTVTPSAASQNHVIYPRVLFRRLTKTTTGRGDQYKP